MSKIIPILKWAGGKRQLLPYILPLIPEKIGRYYEPFLGAGAVLFELQPWKAVVNDTNTELINVYTTIKNNPEELIALLKKYEKKHSPDFYYKTRDVDRDEKRFAKLSAVEKATRTIYLNRTCYNGLYRVNKSGFFNTPIGHNSSIQIVNAEGILAISEYLNNNEVTLLNGDYKAALSKVTKRDFVFLDPPYYPTTRDYFLRYDRDYFGIESQQELKEICDKLTKKGIKFIQTNSDCPEIRELYSNYKQFQVDVRRSINAKPNGRKGKEIIICNY